MWHTLTAEVVRFLQVPEAVETRVAGSPAHVRLADTLPSGVVTVVQTERVTADVTAVAGCQLTNQSSV